MSTLHEVTRFLMDRQLFNKYSVYTMRELLAGNTVVKAVHDTIKELHTASTNGSHDKKLSVEEVGMIARDKVKDTEHIVLNEFLKLVGNVDPRKYTDESVKKAFENAHKKSIAAYLAATVHPVLQGAEALDIPRILHYLENSSNTLFAKENEVEYSKFMEVEPPTLKTIPTYIRNLDEVIDGGLSPGQLATYVGWPGVGKTLLLHQSAALAYYNGYKAALITLEISKEETCRRLDMFFGRSKDESQYNAVRDRAKERGGELVILDGADSSFTPASVASFLEGHRRRGRPVDILYIDYADLMETGRNLEDYNELGEIYKELRKISNKFDVPIWTASQAVRGALNKRWLGMADIADSFKKARIADLIVTINQTEEEQYSGEIRLYIAKSRRNKGHPEVHLKTDMDRMAVVSQ